MTDSIQWVKTRPTLTWIRFLGAIVILSFALSGYTVVKQSQASAERAADRKAANTSQVSGCYQQIRNAPSVLKILGLLDALATNSILSNSQALAIAEPGDPLIPVRKRSLRRIVPRRAALREFVQRAAAKVPTLAACDALARTLDVDPAPFRTGLKPGRKQP